MGTLTDCLRRAGAALPAEDVEFIKTNAAEYERQGMPAKEAALRAISDLMDEARSSVRSWISEIEAQGVEVPARYRDMLSDPDNSGPVPPAPASMPSNVEVPAPARATAATAARSDAAADRTAADENDGEPALAIRWVRRAAPVDAVGAIDRASLETLAARVERGTGIAVRVVDSSADEALPASVRGRQPDAQAVTDGVTIWLVRENIANARHAHAVVAHEFIGHIGVERIVGAEEWPGIRASIEAIAAGRDSGPVPDAVRAAWRRYADAPVERRVREALAVMAERGLAGSIWERLAGGMRRALRRHVAFVWSDADLRALISAAARIDPAPHRTPEHPAFDFFAQHFDPNDPADAERLLASIPDRLAGARMPAAGRLADAIATARPAWLKLMTRQQIVEIGSDVLPDAKAFERLVQRMEADANQLAQDAGEIAMRWSRLLVGVGQDRDAAGRLAELMHQATLNEVDPAEPLPARATVAERAKHAALRTRFLALPERAQALFREVRDAYARRRDAFEQALLERVDRAELSADRRAALRAKLRAEFEANRARGPYFPLGRFGDFWVAAVRGGERTFILAETQRQQRGAINELERLGWTVSYGKKLRKLAADGAPGLGFVSEVAALIERGEANADVAERLKDELYQLYLESLPEQSIRKQFLHRQGTPGFSADALRVFAHHMSHGARQIARLRYGDRLSAMLRRMADQVESARDPNKAADIVNALDDALAWLMNPSGSTWATRATSLGFAWYLGFSPAAAVVNLTQQAMVTYPWLGAKYGAGPAAAALARANTDYMRATTSKGRKALEAGFDGDVGRMLDELESAGRIDRTQTMALAGLSEESAQLSVVEQRVMRVVGWAFQQVERMNRESTALAAYRLARAAGVDHALATEAAREAVDRTHYDYSSGNRAPFMRSDLARVALLFKQYAQNTTYFIGRSVWEAFKGEDVGVRREAWRRLAGVVGMSGLMAGAMGMPIATLLLATLSLARALLDDDEEPIDVETEFRAWLQRTFGQRWGEVATTGLPNELTGLDIGGRVGIDPVRLWVRPPDRELENRGLALHYLEQAAGPVFGIVTSAARGVDLMSDGHIMRGVEQMVPKAVRDLVKSERFATEGATSLRGAPVVDDLGAWEVWGQAMGFTPARLSQAYERYGATRRYIDRMRAQRSSLFDRYSVAIDASDTTAHDAVLAEINAWNDRYPSYRISVAQLKAARRSRIAMAAGEPTTKSEIALRQRIDELFEPSTQTEDSR